MLGSLGALSEILETVLILFLCWLEPAKEETMSRVNDRSLKCESRIEQILAKVREMCKQAVEDQCVQPALEEELEMMLFRYVK